VRISGGQVYDVRNGTFAPLDVVVEGERIAALEPHGPTDGGTVDADGLFLLPGLIDAHIHLVCRSEDADPAGLAEYPDPEHRAYAEAAARRTVLAGITSARDLGGWNYVEMDVRDEVEAGRILGPRLFLSGRLLSMPTGAVRYFPGMYEVASGPEAVRTAAREQLGRGADQIKVMATGAILSPEEEDAGATQFTPEELRAAVEEAEAVGAPVAAHAHARDGMENATLAGVSSVEHGTFADESVLRLMAERGTFLVPTLSARAPSGGLDGVPDHIWQRLVNTERTHVEAMRLAHRLGVRIAMGTDAGTPGNRHGANPNETVLMVEEVGMSPEEALAASTVNPATLLRHQDDLGRIEPGMLADVIGFRGDPRADIHELMRVVFVMKGGRVIRDDRGED
jgi:imidazolonepropionase-like amidohydrolase